MVSSFAFVLLGHTAGLIVGLFAVVLAVTLLFARVIRPRPRTRRFEGFLIYDRRTSKLIEHDFDYEFGRNVGGYLDAAFAEDASIRAIWDRNPIGGESIPPDKEKRKKSLDLLSQAAEYFVLSNFSTRLSDHFRSGDFDPRELDTLTHTDLPDVLLQNRFLRLFAEPMEDRAPFDFDPEVEAGGRIYMANGQGGALYERFEMVLPRGWSVRRSDSGVIEIITRRFLLTVRTVCEGWGAVISPVYISDYLGLTPLVEDKKTCHSALRVDVTIDISPRSVWSLTDKSWKYYRWIDDWIADLEPQLSQVAYFRRIGFQHGQTVQRLLANRDHADKADRSAVSAGRAAPKPRRKTSRSETRGNPFVKGDVVEHATFGRGKVVGTEPEMIVIVRFNDDGSTRKLMAPYAPLRLVPA